MAYEKSGGQQLKCVLSSCWLLVAGRRLVHSRPLSYELQGGVTISRIG